MMFEKENTCETGQPLCVSCRFCNKFAILHQKDHFISECMHDKKVYVNVGVCKDYQESRKCYQEVNHEDSNK